MIKYFFCCWQSSAPTEERSCNCGVTIFWYNNLEPVAKRKILSRSGEHQVTDWQAVNQSLAGLLDAWTKVVLTEVWTLPFALIWPHVVEQRTFFNLTWYFRQILCYDRAIQDMTLPCRDGNEFIFFFKTPEHTKRSDAFTNTSATVFVPILKCEFIHYNLHFKESIKSQPYMKWRQ